uniref:NADH-ubiquinone oxidoreductase chain 4 n=1 Tax=Mycopsylla proxima TaxID=1681221 RepID=A0A343UQS8_9HEMI|nr:NADH dehydrogenase subunit 4 [Mycopsylla proxima]AVF97053.1 NADH dehydrogenase subunit 4 [Mycopsylla proxima]
MLEILIVSYFILVGLSWTMTMNFFLLIFIMSLLLIFDSGMYLLKMVMVLLSMWLVMMMFFSVDFVEESFLLKLMFMLIFYFLNMVFYSSSMFMFYIGFEISVIPILLVIFGWGYQPDRLEAGFYMILYTVFFSLPLLVGIYIYEYQLMKKIILIFMLAFLVKFPLFGIHLWLPRAHVEAPLYGSMILAGVMLKLGGYGLIKISFLDGDLIFFYSEWLVIYSIIGGVALSLICFLQSDMKVLIAYSSIIHMSLTLSGILTFFDVGLLGGIYMMVGHGVCSSGLFCILGFLYVRSHSRSIYVNHGILQIMPICSFWWFLFCVANLSFPPSLNLAGEIFLLTSVMSWNWSSLTIFIIVGLMFLSSLYSIYLFSFSQYGAMKKMFTLNFFSLSESLVMFLHWVPLNILILDLSLFF